MNRSPRIRLAAACLAATLLAVSLPALASADDVSIQAIPTFTITGTGFGHGIGMSQYGARGSALAGKDHEWILQHYYTGTTLGSVTSPEPKVNIDCAYRDATYPGRPYWTVKSLGSALKVWRTWTFDPTDELAADTWYRFSTDGTDVIISTEAGAEVKRLDYDVWISPASASGLLEVKEKSTSTDGSYHPLDTAGWPTNGFTNVRYRGKLWMRRIGTRMGAINQLPMDHYLYGVVPREMPASWGDDTPEALEAQAIAARSYAHADVSGGRVLTCTTYSQVYKGHSSALLGLFEDARTNDAVDDTTARYILTGSAVATGYFFSHSGGWTANNEDVWVGGTPLSYTRSVADTYEHLANPPYAPWPAEKVKTLSGLEIADKLRGLTGVPPSPTHVTGATFERAASGHVRYVNFVFSNGATARISGDSTRSRLGLLSTNFEFSGFPIQRIEGPDRYATAVAVSQQAFTSTAPAVVLASGEDYADALAGSALAGAAEGALLLTARDALPLVTSVELTRLSPSAVYILGGDAAISSEVEDAVQALLPSATIIKRMPGKDRYETAYLVAEEAYALAPGNTAIVVSGQAWPDAASVSGVAYGQKAPILLTTPDTLGQEAEQYLSERSPSIILVVGGPAVLSTDIDVSVEATAGGVAKRLAGADRYETSAEVARWAIGFPAFFTYDEVYMATGLGFADALTGGTLAGVKRKPMLLTAADDCPSGTAAFLTENKLAIGQIYLFGGEAAISEKGRDAIDAVMMQ